MAIDSAAKRRSVSGIPSVPLGPGVTPDASAGQAWRQSVAWGYNGILADAPVAVVLQAYTADVFANPMPAVDVRANVTPTVDVYANPTPTVEVYNG